MQLRFIGINTFTQRDTKAITYVTLVYLSVFQKCHNVTKSCHIMYTKLDMHGIVMQPKHLIKFSPANIKLLDLKNRMVVSRRKSFRNWVLSQVCKGSIVPPYMHGSTWKLDFLVMIIKKCLKLLNAKNGINTVPIQYQYSIEYWYYTETSIIQ